MKKAKKRIIKIVISVVVSLLPVIIVASGLLAIWSFICGLAASIVGFFEPVAPDKVDISNYTLEKIIEVADDDSIITDKFLKELMIDRDSFKRLLSAINNYNTTYDQAEKKYSISIHIPHQKLKKIRTAKR